MSRPLALHVTSFKNILFRLRLKKYSSPRDHMFCFIQIPSPHQGLSTTYILPFLTYKRPPNSPGLIVIQKVLCFFQGLPNLQAFGETFKLPWNSTGDLRSRETRAGRELGRRNTLFGITKEVLFRDLPLGFFGGRIQIWEAMVIALAASLSWKKATKNWEGAWGGIKKTMCSMVRCSYCKSQSRFGVGEKKDSIKPGHTWIEVSCPTCLQANTEALWVDFLLVKEAIRPRNPLFFIKIPTWDLPWSITKPTNQPIPTNLFNLSSVTCRGKAQMALLKCLASKMAASAPRQPLKALAIST